MENNDVVVPLSPESLRQLGATQEEIAAAEAAIKPAEKKPEPPKEEPAKKVETPAPEKQEAKQETVDLYKKAFEPKQEVKVEDPKKVLEPTEREELERFRKEKQYEAEQKMFDAAMDKVPADRRAEVDKALAQLIAGPDYDELKGYTPEKRALTLVALAEKLALGNIEKTTQEKAQATEAEQSKAEEAKKEIKEISNFNTPATPPPTKAEQLARLMKDAESDNPDIAEAAVDKMLELQRTYSADDVFK